MSWQQVQFVVDAKQADPLSDMLESFLALSITRENAGEQDYLEAAFPKTPDWQRVKISALFDQQVDTKAIINFVQSQLSIDTIATCQTVENQDWERAWLDSFKPIKVGHRLWICPSWLEPIEKEEDNITLDPGLAFGTGTHATTHLCLQWISEQSLTGHQVLDYGSGTGILSIASIIRGASLAHAVDIDPLAVQACIENAQRNNVQEHVIALLPEDYQIQKHQLVIANILAEVIIELRDTLINSLSERGTLLLTGILEHQADKVKAHFPELNFSQKNKDQWCLLIAHK